MSNCESCKQPLPSRLGVGYELRLFGEIDLARTLDELTKAAPKIGQALVGAMRAPDAMPAVNAPPVNIVASPSVEIANANVLRQIVHDGQNAVHPGVAAQGIVVDVEAFPEFESTVLQFFGKDEPCDEQEAARLLAERLSAAFPGLDSNENFIEYIIELRAIVLDAFADEEEVPAAATENAASDAETRTE